jgi:hypothetical protein
LGAHGARFEPSEGLRAAAVRPTGPTIER